MTPDIDALARRLRAAGCVFAEEEAGLLLGEGWSADELHARVARRVTGEPLETVLGWVLFAGRRLRVGPGVFVPRRRTELLARAAAERMPTDGVLVELCCGAAPVAAVVPAREAHAADLSATALAWARLNAPQARVHEGDLYSALPSDLRGRVDVLVANAPHVPSDEIRLMPPEARVHEPRLALDGGADGARVQRRIAEEAPAWLAPGGVLALETGPGHPGPVLEAVVYAGLDARLVVDETVGGAVVVGTPPAATRRAAGR